MTVDLLLPVHLHGLVLKEAMQVAGAPLDYKRLPWFDGQRDHNGSVPYLADAISDAPFAPHPLWLQPGVHLHWTLPDGLKRGATRPDSLRSVQVGELYLPPAPNRWLVLRLPEDPNAVAHQDDDPHRAWLIESDYVYPEGTRPDTPAVVYPRRPQTGRRPWMHVGRALELNPDTLVVKQGRAGGNEAENLAQLGGPLTALGPGDPTFAASYPSCHSVFGLHDDRPSERDVRYVVYGWYSDAVGDPVARSIAALREDPERLAELLRDAGQVSDHAAEAAVSAGAIGRDQRELSVKQFLRQAMDLTYFGTDVQQLDGVLVQGQMVVSPQASAPSTMAEKGLFVGIGSSAAEALVALKSKESNASQDLEDRMVQSLAATDLRAHPLDLGAKLSEARHSEQFQASRGHTIWVLRKREDLPQEADPHPIPEATADLLAQLNHAQRAYDRSLKRIEGLRQELFNDWSQYMRVLYPEGDSDGFVVPPGQVRDLIDVTRLRPLERALAATGRLYVSEAADGSIDVTDLLPDAEAGFSETLAAEIVRAHRVLLAALNPVSGQPPQHHLALAPGPQFWSPNDPVIVLEDRHAQPRDHHGSAGSRVPAGDHTSRTLSTAYVFNRNEGWRNKSMAFGQTLRAPVGLLQADIHTTTVTDAQSGRSDWPWVMRPSPGDWEPLSLEWEAEVQPLADGTNLMDKRYDPKLVSEAHHLPPDAADMTHRKSRPATAPSFSYLSGRTILNPAAGKLMAKRLAELPKALRDRFDPVEGTPMVLPLGGFHELLLMRDHRRQLQVEDPIGLSVSRDLTDRVRSALGAFHPAHPRRDAVFHPIRTGELHLQRLRVRDVFGRGHDWVPEGMKTTRRMRPEGDGANKARLPLRLAQAARLNFRWLRSGSDDEEASMHPASSPIMGWLLPNALDGAIEIYDWSGDLLGHVDDRATWHAAPGDDAAPKTADQIRDPGLRQVVAWMSRGGADLPGRMIDLLESALEQIEPVDSARLRSVSALVGRPLALVRAHISLELAHHMALDQSLTGLRARLSGHGADTHGVEALDVPVRLGEHGQLNDGLCGYWIETRGGYAGDAFHATQGVETEDDHPRLSKIDAADVHPVIVRPDQPGVTVTLLIEPHGSVHATTGLLPSKSIALMEEHFHDALDRLRVPLRTGPILTPRDTVELPLPDAPGYGLSWLERGASGWKTTPHHPSIPLAAFEAGFGAQAHALWQRLITDGRLVEEVGLDRAFVMSAAPDTAPDRYADLGFTAEQVDRGLLALADAVMPVVLEPRNRPRPIARDGWIVLRPDPSSDPEAKVTGNAGGTSSREQIS